MSQAKKLSEPDGLNRLVLIADGNTTRGQRLAASVRHEIGVQGELIAPAEEGRRELEPERALPWEASVLDGRHLSGKRGCGGGQHKGRGHRMAPQADRHASSSRGREQRKAAAV